MDKRRVIIIGAGKRVERVILPALYCLQDDVEIVNIMARTARLKSFLDKRLEVSIVTEVADVVWSSTELVIIAVPKEAVASVLRKIPRQFRSRLILLVDTPVIPLRSLGTLRIFDDFKRVLVSEDYLGVPFFEAAKVFLQEGKIGDLHAIHFMHSGYRYHALAAIKHLSGCSTFSYIRMRNRGAVERDIRTANNVRAHILEPRDYRNGRTLIVGAKGTIGDYPLQGLNHRMLDTSVGSAVFFEGKLVGNNEITDKALRTHGDGVVPQDQTDAAKVYGFMRLVQASFEPVSNYHYQPLEAVYDNLACAVSDRFGWFFDIPFGKTSVVKIGIRIFARILSRPL